MNLTDHARPFYFGLNLRLCIIKNYSTINNSLVCSLCCGLILVGRADSHIRMVAPHHLTPGPNMNITCATRQRCTLHQGVSEGLSQPVRPHCQVSASSFFSAAARCFECLQSSIPVSSPQLVVARFPEDVRSFDHSQYQIHPHLATGFFNIKVTLWVACLPTTRTSASSDHPCAGAEDTHISHHDRRHSCDLRVTTGLYLIKRKIIAKLNAERHAKSSACSPNSCQKLQVN